MNNGNGHDESRLDRIERVLEQLAGQDAAFHQRMDRLTERHEALAQTVEIIGQMQRENEVRQKKNEVLLAQSLEAINSLARIAQSHERRLDDMEGQH